MSPWLDQGYNPKRGRYKRFAQLLAAGSAITLAGRTEAVKARVVWQHYVPRDQRIHLGATIRRIGMTKKYAVIVFERS